MEAVIKRGRYDPRKTHMNNKSDYRTKTAAILNIFSITPHRALLMETHLPIQQRGTWT